MKLFKRLIIILGGGAAAAFLIHALIMFIGFNAHEKSIHSTIYEMQEETLSQSVKGSVLGSSAYLEEKLNSRFRLLRMVLLSNDPESMIKRAFKERDCGDIDYIIIEKNGTPVCLVNPDRKSRKDISNADGIKQFVHQMREEIGKKQSFVYAVELYPGSLWVVCADHKTDKLAVLRMDGDFLLESLPSGSPDIASALVYGSDFVAIGTPAGTPPEVVERMKGICKKADHVHAHRLIANSVLVDKNQVPWRAASAHLYTKSEIETGLHLIQAQKTPEKSVQNIAGIKGSFLAIQVIFAGTVLFAILLFLPVLLIVARHLSRQLNDAVVFVKNVFQSEQRPRNLELKFSSEMEELSGVLNLLRDKLSSALSRLSRSHERELRAKKEAEESNILRSGLLNSVLCEIRDPLSRIDGFSRIIQKKVNGDTDLSYAAEQIRVENRAMISVFRALSDLTSLDSDFCELGSYQIEPSEIIRDAMSDLTARAARSNISLEIRNVTVLNEPVTTSPSVLTHTVYTAAATLIRFMPMNTTLRISTELRNNTLVFRFADQVSDHISIAEVFRRYTETGVIDTPHCAVAVLNLLILKSETELLGADVRIENNKEANSMIEIILPVRAFNPAVTGVFTRPKLTADTAKVSSASRFHVAGIIGSSMSGRDPFRAEGSIGAVLLANMKDPDATLYRMLFESEGFAIAAAENEEERFGYIRSNRFDLVLLDMTLEKSDDYSVISNLRKALPETTVLIVFTDSRKVEYVEKLMSSGADFCFRKPVVTTDLLDSVNKLKNGGKDFL